MKIMHAILNWKMNASLSKVATTAGQHMLLNYLKALTLNTELSHEKLTYFLSKGFSPITDGFKLHNGLIITNGIKKALNQLNSLHNQIEWIKQYDTEIDLLLQTAVKGTPQLGCPNNYMVMTPENLAKLDEVTNYRNNCQKNIDKFLAVFNINGKTGKDETNISNTELHDLTVKIVRIMTLHVTKSMGLAFLKSDKFKANPKKVWFINFLEYLQETCTTAKKDSSKVMIQLNSTTVEISDKVSLVNAKKAFDQLSPEGKKTFLTMLNSLMN